MVHNKKRSLSFEEHITFYGALLHELSPVSLRQTQQIDMEGIFPSLSPPFKRVELGKL